MSFRRCRTDSLSPRELWPCENNTDSTARIVDLIFGRATVNLLKTLQAIEITLIYSFLTRMTFFPLWKQSVSPMTTFMALLKHESPIHCNCMEESDQHNTSMNEGTPNTIDEEQIVT